MKLRAPQTCAGIQYSGLTRCVRDGGKRCVRDGGRFVGGLRIARPIGSVVATEVLTSATSWPGLVPLGCCGTIAGADAIRGLDVGTSYQVPLPGLRGSSCFLLVPLTSRGKLRVQCWQTRKPRDA
jgi:hypothetical protein